MHTTNRRRFAGLVAGVFGLSLGALGGAPEARARAAPQGSRAGGPPADDKLAIIELMARYAWAYDTTDAAALASTFTEDGVLEVWGNVMASSAEDFVRLMDQAETMRGEHGWQHLTNHHVFRDYDGQRCTVYSYYLMPQSDPTGGNVTVRAMGYYVSYCVLTEKGWLFEKRSVSRWDGKAPMAI